MKKLIGILFGAISAITFGTNPLFGVRLLDCGVSVQSMLFWRFMGAAAFIFPVLLLLKTNFAMSKRQTLLAILLGLLFAISAETLFEAFTVMAAGVASTMLFLYPIFVALIMALKFGEHIGKSTVAAIILSSAGVAFLGLGDAVNVNISFYGSLLVILSALSYAFYIVIVKTTSISKLDGMTLTFYSMLFAGIFIGVKGLFSHAICLPSNQNELLYCIGLILVPTVISITCISYSIKYAGATIAAVLGALEPLTAVAICAILLGETFTFSLGAGIALITSAVVILTLANAKRTS